MSGVEEKLAAYPEALALRLQQIRDLVQAVATSDKAIGMIEQSLKWGQISFATLPAQPGRPKSGTPIRIDGDGAGGTYSLFVPCSTNLIEGFRTVHPHMFNYHGNREIRLELNKPLPETELSMFIATALRYYLN